MAPTILVVEDHPETCILIARMLRSQGYHVAAVTDGAAARAAASAQPPDLIIADVLLPGLNVLTVVDTLRQQDPLLPVIVISAVPDVLERLETVPAGLDPGSLTFLAKPFGLESLIALVHQLLPDALLG